MPLRCALISPRIGLAPLVTLTMLSGLLTTAATSFAGTETLVQSVAVSGDTPTPSDNDYTRINDAIQAATPGETIRLEGVFDWTEANAMASWVLGSDGTPSTGDDYSIFVPTVNGVTLTATSLGDATIHGPGDLAGIDLEGCLYFSSQTGQQFFQNWTVSNLQFEGFDFSIGMFFDSGGSVDAFDDVVIENNLIRIPADIAAADETFQNIGLHYSFGSDQRIYGNVFEIPGDTSSDTAGSGIRSAIVAMQSNTSGGAVYDGLLIENNQIQILGAQAADPAFIAGIWENGSAHTSNITVRGNAFVNMSPDNDPALNLQRAFRITSHSSATTTSLYENNEVYGANIGFSWLTYSTPIDFNDREPVIATANTFVGNETAVIVRSNGNGLFRCNRFFDNAVGLENANSDPGTITDADANENWWGCNEGPNTADCDGTIADVTAVQAPSWLLLTAQPDQPTVPAGAPTPVLVELTQTTAGVPASCTMPNGIPAVFAAVGGVVTPPEGTIDMSTGQTTFIAGSVDGLAAAFTAVDNEVVAALVEVDATMTDLAVSMTSAPTQAMPGDSVTWTATIDNAGFSNAPDALFDFPLPSNVTACTWACASNTGGACGNPGTGAISDSFDLPAGAKLTYVLTCTYSPVPDTLKARGCGSASVNNSMTDPDADNNSACSIVFSAFTDIFVDGFESGDTTAWSATVN